jgi:CRP-like cAMP-binding protein
MLFQSLPVQNRILGHLPVDAFDILQPHLQRVPLRKSDILQWPNRQVSRIYFLECGLANIFANTERDGQVEVGIVGRFGLIGVPVVLGTMSAADTAIMEVAGEALQIKSRHLRRSMDQHPAIRQQLMNYVHALLIQNSQTILCNARHQIRQRLTRWLLLAHDRLDDNVIPLTHELFSLMLGVRRADITAGLAQLERARAIRRGRGAVEILDRALLERITCECYHIIAAQYQRLVDPSATEEMQQSNGYIVVSN